MKKIIKYKKEYFCLENDLYYYLPSIIIKAERGLYHMKHLYILKNRRKLSYAISLRRKNDIEIQEDSYASHTQTFWHKVDNLFTYYNKTKRNMKLEDFLDSPQKINHNAKLLAFSNIYCYIFLNKKLI